MTNDRDFLAGSLKDFGLSDYEARAYVTLLKNGPLIASEVGYHANIPRTKTYPTIRALARKGLASMLPGSPLRCRAVSPNESLDTFVMHEERRIRSLRKTMVQLVRLRDQANKPLATEQANYLILGPQAITEKLQELLVSSKQHVHCILDGWGIHLLEEAYEGLSTAIANDVEINVIVGPNEDELEVVKIPPEITVRFAKGNDGFNLIMIDETILTIDSKRGKGSLIHSPDIQAIFEGALFNRLWEQSINGNRLTSLIQVGAGTADVFDLLDQRLLNEAFLQAVSEGINEEHLRRIGTIFVSKLQEKVHASIFNEPIEASLPLLTVLLRESLGENSSVRYDNLTKLLTIEVDDGRSGIPASIWMYALAGISNRNDNELKLLHNVAYPGQSNRILQAKISHVTAG